MEWKAKIQPYQSVTYYANLILLIPSLSPVLRPPLLFYSHFLIYINTITTRQIKCSINRNRISENYCNFICKNRQKKTTFTKCNRFKSLNWLKSLLTMVNRCVWFECHAHHYPIHSWIGIAWTVEFYLLLDFFFYFHKIEIRSNRKLQIVNHKTSELFRYLVFFGNVG